METIRTLAAETEWFMKLKSVEIYTDGGSLGNPGPGGYGVVLIYGEHRRELSEGFRETTNNRMELLACIRALETLKYPCEVTLHSDSQYVVNGIEKGWAVKWRDKGWMRNKTDKAENADLWDRLLELRENHEVTFKWVRGHAGIAENERCDQLVKQAANGSELKRDVNYETGKTREPVQPTFE